MGSTSRSEERSEIVFFDVETTAPWQGRVILEFGAILVCPRKLEELEYYSTLVRPANPALIASLSNRRNGITRDNIFAASTFGEIADRVYDILQGRIWAGHNIRGFDCARIEEAFAEIGRPAPKPKATIDSLALLTKWFGRRAGDMKMASLATYFGLGEQTHRSLDDVRMNLAILKYCSTVLVLEASLVRSSAQLQRGPFDMGLPISISESLEPDTPMEEMLESSEMSSTADVTFLDPDEVSISAIDASFVPFYRGSPRIQLLHKGVTLQLSCVHLNVRFGLSKISMFVDHAGLPRLNFVVYASQSLCKVLDACDGMVQKLSLDSGSSSKWWPVVSRKDDFVNYTTVKLNIPTATSGDSARYVTEIYRKESSGAVQRLVFSTFDAAELEPLFNPGTFLDAFVSVDPYDFQRNAGIRLVAKILILDSN